MPREQPKEIAKKTKKKKILLHVEKFTQNISTLAEDLKPPKRARNPPHNWVKQKGEKKRERERERNQDGTNTTERDL